MSTQRPIYYSLSLTTLIPALLLTGPRPLAGRAWLWQHVVLITCDFTDQPKTSEAFQFKEH